MNKFGNRYERHGALPTDILLRCVISLVSHYRNRPERTEKEISFSQISNSTL